MNERAMPNPNCTEQTELDLGVMDFGRLGRREVQGCFDGGSMTSDGGVMLLSALDRKLGLTTAAAACIADPRDPLLITHAVRDMLRQRVYGLALGWEDLNDHQTLRHDVALQTAVGVDREVASSPTLCRLEKWADRATAVRLSELLVEQFIASFSRVITRLEYGEQGNNPRYVVTNLTGEPQQLYDKVYCQRGEAENRIKEAQVGLFATRTSCHVFQSNQLRVLLAGLAYVLIERLRALALQGTELAHAQVDTLRTRLLKLAAVVIRNTRRIRLYFASNWPSAPIFAQAMKALGAT